MEQIWNDKIENVLLDTLTKCKKYKHISLEASKKASLYYNILMYTLIILSPVSGILSALNTDSNEVKQHMITIFSFLLGTISTVLKFSKLEKKMASYKSLASKYSSLENNISRQLAIDKENRIRPVEYLEWISKNYEELFSITPFSESNEKKEEKKEDKIEIVLKKDDVDPSIVDLNKYSDNKMKYELSRLNRF